MQWIFSQISTSDPVTSYATPLISLGGFGLLLVLLLTGRVVTKASYDEMREDREAWKATAELAVQTLSADQTSLKQFADQGEVTNRLLTEIKGNTRNKPR